MPPPSKIEFDKLKPMDWFKHFKYAIIVVGVIVLITIVCLCVVPRTRYSEVLKTKNVKIISGMLEQIKKHHLRSVQDSHPMLALENSIKAKQLCELLKHTMFESFNNEEIEHITATNIKELSEIIDVNYRKNCKVVHTFCPSLPQFYS